MGRIFQTNQSTQTAQPTASPASRGGRIFGTGNTTNRISEFVPTKSWEDMNFGEKAWLTAKELPATLYNFIPPSVREAIQKPTPQSIALAIPKGAAEFATQIANVSVQGVGGGILAAKQAITGKPESVKIPFLPEVSEKLGLKEMPQEVSSWQVQSKQLQDQGFSEGEAQALVGINAYLGAMPGLGRLARTKAASNIGQAITTKKVPVAETPQGIKATIKTPAIAEPLPVSVESPIVGRVKPTIEQKIKLSNDPIIQEQEMNLLMSLELAEPGYRTVIKNVDPMTGAIEHSGVIGVPSSLPEWLPAEFRHTSLLKSVVKQIYEDRVPTKASEVRLYNYLAEELAGKTKSNEEIFTARKPEAAGIAAEVQPNQIPEIQTTRIERPFITGIKEKLGQTSEQKEFHNLLQEHLDKYFEGRESLLSKEEPLNKALLKLNDNELKTYSDITQGLIKEAKPSENLKTAVDMWRKANQEIETDLIKAGKLTAEQVENRRWKPVENTTGRTRDELQSLGVEPIYYPYLAESLLKKSDFIATTGKRTKGGFLKRFTGKMLAEDSYIKNPQVAIPRHRLQVFRDKMNNEMVENIKTTFAEQDKTIITEYKNNPKFAEAMGVEEWKPAGSLRFYSGKFEPAKDILQQIKYQNEPLERSFAKVGQMITQAEGEGVPVSLSKRFRTAAGAYYPKTNEIKLKYFTPEVLLHEIGHSWDYINGRLSKVVNENKTFQKELRILTEEFYGMKSRQGMAVEKWAVFIDKYIHEPKFVKENAPGFTAYFKKKLETDYAFKEAYQEAGKQIRTINKEVENIKPTLSKFDPELKYLQTALEKAFPSKRFVGVSKNVESYWIPKNVAAELKKFYTPDSFEKFMRMTYDPLIDLWRVSVLNLAPRWLYNNVVGNTILATLGKTDPVAFFSSAKEMFARTKLGGRLNIVQREIPKGVFMKEYAGGEMPKAGKIGSLAKEQTQFMQPLDNWLNLLEQAKQYPALKVPAIITQNLINGYVALGKPIGFLNKVAENWFRGAMYISKTEGKFLGMKLDKPVPPAEGVKYVNEFLFDYTKLSRVERATFRRALPFWNWMKNIAQFSFKFPVNHPMRGLVCGALLQDYVDFINENQSEDKSKSVLRIKTDMVYEGKPLYVNVKSAIPFSDVFNTIPTSFQKFGRLLASNPVSKIIIERGYKINSFTGQPFTQPSQLQEFDEWGKPVLPLPSLGQHVANQFPQTKLIQSISDQAKYGAVLKRYETGEPKMYRNQIQTSDLLMEVLGYFGIKLSPTEYNEIKKSVDKKSRLQEIKGQRYERQIETSLDKLKK